jgi:hypothetical protein
MNQSGNLTILSRFEAEKAFKSLAKKLKKNSSADSFFKIDIANDLVKGFKHKVHEGKSKKNR